MNNNGLVILGFGGHARSVANVALSLGFESLLFVDEHARECETFLSFNVVRELPADLPAGWAYFPAAGDNHKRQAQVEFILASQKKLATLVSQSAMIGVGATLSPGCFIAHFAHIGPMAHIGMAGIINTGAIVEHECQVGDFCHVSVNATLAGRSKLGQFVFLGAGATVIDSIAVADEVVIGAGAVVVNTIEQSGTYMGVPAKRLQQGS